MTDRINQVVCTDCNSVASYSFVLGAIEKGKTFFVLIAACPVCKGRGDKRSLRSMQKAEASAFAFAVEHKLPSVLLS